MSYTEHNFKPRQVLTAEVLNEMDRQIASLSETSETVVKVAELAVSVTNGKYIDPYTGDAETIAAGFAVTDYIDISAYSSIIFTEPHFASGATRPSGADIGYALYDDEKEFLDGAEYYALSGEACFTETVLNRPSTCKYVRFTIDKSVGNALRVWGAKVGTVRESAGQKLADLIYSDDGEGNITVMEVV